jgi:hypothetical protein
MTAFLIVYVFIPAASMAIGFGMGYALGYNVAKHPEKVKAQAEDIVSSIKR